VKGVEVEVEGVEGDKRAEEEEKAGEVTPLSQSLSARLFFGLGKAGSSSSIDGETVEAGRTQGRTLLRNSVRIMGTWVRSKST
jgi:hypothetical protein